jgi:hypothetical protein
LFKLTESPVFWSEMLCERLILFEYCFELSISQRLLRVRLRVVFG